MIALIQRVKEAKVEINNKCKSQINSGICVFIGISRLDNSQDIEFIVNKIAKLNFFEFEDKPFALSLSDLRNSTKQEILVVSQFTLYANLNKGKSPSFTEAMNGKDAKQLYEQFCQKLISLGYTIKTGEFGAYMQISLVNDGPASFILSSDHLGHHDATSS